MFPRPLNPPGRQTLLEVVNFLLGSWRASDGRRCLTLDLVVFAVSTSLIVGRDLIDFGLLFVAQDADRTSPRCLNDVGNDLELNKMGRLVSIENN
jgi:hypothetical protein